MKDVMLEYIIKHELIINFCRAVSTVGFVQKVILVYHQSAATLLTTVRQDNINVLSLLPVYTLDLDNILVRLETGFTFYTILVHSHVFLT